MRWWHRLRYEYGLKDLRAAHQVETAASGDAHAFQSTGNDPHFRFRRPLNPGWYMAEVALTVPAGRADARFYLDTGHGESETLAFGLPVRNGKTAKRVLYIPVTARLRFDPLASEGPFEVNHFRVVRMRQSAALQRVLSKLANLHPRYRPGNAIASAPLPDRATLLADYNALFESSGADHVSYAEWVSMVETPQIPSLAEQIHEARSWPWHPRISILLPTFNTPAALLRECLDSVLAQTYPHWELCVADDASTHRDVREILADYAGRDQRIQIALRGRNGHIAEASNTALALASGDYIALLDHDDTLAPHALFAVAQAVHHRPSAQIVYSDEDKLDQNGLRCDPFFKPDWSPDLLYSQNYVSHLGVYHRQLVQAVGGFRPGFEGSQDYDLLLRCAARVSQPQDIVHVPQVLYHWRKAEGSTALGHDQKDYASQAALRALQAHFDAHHPGATATLEAPGIYRHRWPLPETPPLVSLIVPTRDGYEHLKTCIDSILHKTTYPHYEILVVDNQSTCPLTLSYLDNLRNGTQGQGRVRVLSHDQAFNYSAINNEAAAQARGSVLGLVNNDVEVISPEWLTEMISHAIRPDVGCVGAKLYYPDGTLQHAGVVLGIGGVAGHSHKYFPGSASGYFSRLRTVHNVSAVTGAVLLVRKATFEAVGMLDAQGLSVAFNDVDLCIKVRNAGYRNVWTPYAELYHHESKSRGADESPEKQARFANERELMLARWGHALQHDPFYNPHLTLVEEDYGFTLNTRHTNAQAPADAHSPEPA